METTISLIHTSLKIPQTIKCLKLLRDVPKKRKVFDALWKGEEVIVKLFTQCKRSKRHMKREWKGLKGLEKHNICAPDALFNGFSKEGFAAIVMKKIKGKKIRELLEKGDLQQRLDLLEKVFITLAQQHQQGILQKDLHPDNFLLYQETLFTLDPAQIKFCRNPISKNTSLTQLALLLSQLPEIEVEKYWMLFCKYGKKRGWALNKDILPSINKQIQMYRDILLKKTLKKYLRSNSRHQKLSFSCYRAMMDRSFYAGKNPKEFIENIDHLIEQGEILKKGNTCHVVRTVWNQKDIVIKRYNHKGFFHSLRHSIKGSRSCRCWLYAHRLLRLHIATPVPLAYVEKYYHIGLLYTSYFVTEHIHAPYVYEALASLSGPKRQKAIEQTWDLLEKIGKNNISHGDLKHQNILFSQQGPFIIDLDSMQYHQSKIFFQRERNKDLKRFAKNWQNLPEIGARFEKLTVKF